MDILDDDEADGNGLAETQDDYGATPADWADYAEFRRVESQEQADRRRTLKYAAQEQGYEQYVSRLEQEADRREVMEAHRQVKVNNLRSAGCICRGIAMALEGEGRRASATRLYQAAMDIEAILPLLA